MLTQAPKGTKDIFGKNIFVWQFIEKKIREICKVYGVSEIRTPIFEHTELFLRSVGETTDIVQKEMYTFEDKGHRSITLRPEGTACVARAFLEHSLYAEAQPTKLYYMNPTFRYEKPQDGRQRQFHQFGVEVFGSDSPITDAETISMALALIEAVGITNTQIRINSLGTAQQRSKYTEALSDYINTQYDKLCPTCKERAKTNPMRILDCKEPGCDAAMKDAPICLDYLDEEGTKHFETLKQTLMDWDIPFMIDPQLVRGLDYYTKTVFEIVSYDIGAQKTIVGGGRYNTMIRDFGGPDIPAFGFGLGMERLILAMNAVGAQNDIDYNRPEYYIGAIGEQGKTTAAKLVHSLRKQGVYAECDLMDRSVKAQLKYANKIGAKRAVIIGDDEIANDLVSVKDMETGDKQERSLSRFAEGL